MHATNSQLLSTLCTNIYQQHMNNTMTIPTSLFLTSWPSLSKASFHFKMVSKGRGLRGSNFNWSQKMSKVKFTHKSTNYSPERFAVSSDDITKASSYVYIFIKRCLHLLTLWSVYLYRYLICIYDILKRHWTWA